jgi:chromosome segregation ATPase
MMPGGWLTSLAALLVALFTGGGLAQLSTIRQTRRALDTDSLRKVADATIVLLDPMRAEIERLEARVARLSENSETATRKWEEAEQRVRVLTVEAEQITANYRRALALLQQHEIPFPWDPAVGPNVVPDSL